MTTWFTQKRNRRTILLLMGFVFVLFRFEGVMDVIQRLMAVLTPFFVGSVIALLVNLPMRWMERTFTFFNKTPLLRKLKRPVSLLLSVLLVVSLIVVMLVVIIPEVKNAIESMIVVLPDAVRQAIDWANNLGVRLRANLDLSVPEQGDVRQQVEAVYQYLVGGLSSSTGILSSAANIMMDAIIGLVFAVYLLSGKEKLLANFRLFTSSYLKPVSDKRLHHVLRILSSTFSDFFAGQCIQAFSSALLTWLFLLIFGIPYAVLIAMLVFITAFIPIFGPYISGAIGMLLVFSQNADMVWWFLLVFFVVQQVSGSVIYPRIMEKAIDMPSIWVLASVTIGGGLMGLMGMMFFIPLTAAVYNLIKEDVSLRQSQGIVPGGTPHG